MTGGWERLTGGDLGLYRVVFAATMLLMLPDFTWVDSFPDSLYQPPPGPMQLLDGFPSVWVMLGIEAGIAVALASLLIGRLVRAASWGATLLLLLGYGFHNSLGKIDHSILVVLTPAVLALAGWGPGSLVRPWVMRLWAFTIGVAMLTAAIPKIAGARWLDPGTQAVRGILTNQVLAFEEHAALSDLAMRVSSPLVWEPVDWSALLEASVVVCALLGLRSFRRILAALVPFHLGVGLTLNIWFSANVIAYGGFVSWTSIRVLDRAAAALSRTPWWSVVPLAVASLAFSRLDLDLHAAVVLAGVAVTVHQVWYAVRGSGPRLGSRRDDPLRASVPRA